MPKVSKHKVDKELESEMFKQLWYSLGKINNSARSSDFFNDFLTESEKIMLAKRFTAAILINRGKSPSEIRESIHLSFSAIGSVSGWIKNAKPKTKDILDKISAEKNWESIIDKVDDILDKLPPKRHSDWKEKYAKKRERTNQRLSRKALR